MAESKEDFSPEKSQLYQALLQHQIQTLPWSENTSCQRFLAMILGWQRKMEMHFQSHTITRSFKNFDIWSLNCK